MAIGREYIEQTFGLAGKTALVTGGYGGLGAAISRALGQAGAAVAVNGRDAARCDQAVMQLEAEGIRAVAAPFDVADGKAVAAAAAMLGSRGECIDILVVNAGIQRRGPFADMPLDQWQAVMDVHVTGAFNCAKAFLPGMLERGFGRIVLMSSVAAQEAMPNISAYATAKGAIGSLTRALAVEYGAGGITVNAIAPGFVRTEFTRVLQDNAAFGRFLEGAVPMGRWAESGEIAPAVVFLASPGAGFINGHVLTIDGGMLAKM